MKSIFQFFEEVLFMNAHFKFPRTIAFFLGIIAFERVALSQDKRENSDGNHSSKTQSLTGRVSGISKAYDPGMLPCGLKGIMEERVAECEKVNKGFEKKTVKTAKNTYTFQLVYRLEDGMEAWRDDQTGIIWCDPLDRATDPSRQLSGKVYIAVKQTTQYLARNSCEDLGLNLPTGEELLEAERHGIRQILPRINERILWTRTGFILNGNKALVLKGGEIKTRGKADGASYSCIHKNWKDRSGLEWTQVLGEPHTWEEANNVCSSLHLRVPEAAEFEVAAKEESSPLRPYDPTNYDSMTDYLFWTSSLDDDPNYPHFAKVWSGMGRKSFEDMKEHKYKVICVNERKQH